MSVLDDEDKIDNDLEDYNSQLMTQEINQSMRKSRLNQEVQESVLVEIGELPDNMVFLP